MLAPSHEVPFMPTVAEIERRRREAAIAHAEQAQQLEAQMQRLEDSIDYTRRQEQENQDG